MICVDSLASKFRSPDLSPYISSPQISNSYNVFFHSQDKTEILQKLITNIKSIDVTVTSCICLQKINFTIIEDIY